VLKAQERRIRLQKLKGELVDKARAETLMFRLAREERDAWVTWPARVAALMASELAAALDGEVKVEAALMQKVLEAHVRAQLDSLAEIRTGLG
jgi:S-methylmethionine-dependent homocysteine/selenocysteine methylase